jgi:hypothetical protein
MTLLRKMAEKVRGLFGNRANDPEFDVEMQEHMRLSRSDTCARAWLRKVLPSLRGASGSCPCVVSWRGNDFENLQTLCARCNSGKSNA